MNEKSYIVETLNPEDFDEWVAHCGSIFEVGSAYFRRHFTADPHKDYNSIFVVKNDGQIISTVRVFHRQVYIDGDIYKMGGIGEVSTNIEYRNQGLSKILLEAAVNYMKKNNFYVSLLGTGYFSHYAKHGYVQVNLYSKYVGGETKANGDGTCDIRPLNADNYADMSSLYDVYAKKYNFSTVRSIDYWKTWCAGEMKNPRGLFKNGRLAGYICAEGNRVSELIADEADHDILLSTVAPENNRIRVPAYVSTKRDFIESRCDNSNMINLFQPVTIRGRTYDTTDALVEYINNNGGIVHWAQDHF